MVNYSHCHHHSNFVGGSTKLFYYWLQEIMCLNEISVSCIQLEEYFNCPWALNSSCQWMSSRNRLKGLGVASTGVTRSKRPSWLFSACSNYHHPGRQDMQRGKSLKELRKPGSTKPGALNEPNPVLNKWIAHVQIKCFLFIFVNSFSKDPQKRSSTRSYKNITFIRYFHC